jgi:membrane protease YdiL (CAAX protease family)
MQSSNKPLTSELSQIQSQPRTQSMPQTHAMTKLRFLLLMVACFLPLVGALTYFYWAPNKEEMRIYYSLSKGLQFTLPIIVWALYKPGILKKVQELFRLPSSKKEFRSTLYWSLGASAFFLVGGYMTYTRLFRSALYSPGLKEALSTKILDFGVHSVFDYYVLAFLISVIHSFLEEYYWRAYVHVEFEAIIPSSTKSGSNITNTPVSNSPNSKSAALSSQLKKWGPWLAIFCSSLAFTLHHIVVISYYAQIENRILVSALACLVVFLCGALWAFMYMRFRNVYAAWISHIAADIVMVGIGYDVLYR